MSRFLWVDARSVIHTQVVGAASTADAVSKTFSVITSESPALQWALEGSHVDVVRDRMVAEDAVTSVGHRYFGGAVIKFLLIPLKKKKSPASTNGKRMRQRDAGRAVLISS